MINEPLLYAQVDDIISNDLFLLMELVPIEPMLFLGHNINAANTLAMEIILLPSLKADRAYLD